MSSLFETEPASDHFAIKKCFNLREKEEES